VVYIKSLQIYHKTINRVIIVSVKTVKARWKNLRDYYLLEVKKLEKPRSGDGTDETGMSSSWLHFTLMSFLKDILKSETRCSNLPVTTPSTQNIEDNGEGDGLQLSILEC
jgi:hypothetical protein